MLELKPKKQSDRAENEPNFYLWSAGSYIRLSNIKDTNTSIDINSMDELDRLIHYLVEARGFFNQE